MTGSNGAIPWHDGTASGLTGPHGIGMDLNGNLYISDINDQEIARLDCDGNIIDMSFISLGGATYNYFEFNDMLYVPWNGTMRVYELCTGTEVACLGVNIGWGVTLGTDGNIYGTAGFNGSGNAVVQVSTDLSGYSTDPSSCGYSSTTVIDETSINVATPNSTFTRPMGVVQDENGNIYIVLNDSNFAGCSMIQKYDASYNLVSSTPWDCDTNDGGWSGGVGITYSQASGKLYVASIDDCVAVFDTDLNYDVSLSLPWPTNGTAVRPKAIGVNTECCPVGYTASSTTECDAQVGDVVFLRDALPCQNLCGSWTEVTNNAGTFNSCNASFTVTNLNSEACYSFNYSGTGECADFDIEVCYRFGEPSTPAMGVIDNDCANGILGSFTVDSPCDVGFNIEYSTDNGATWVSTLPSYSNTSSISVVARCVKADNSCVSPISTPPATSSPTDCPPCPSPNCFEVLVSEN